MADTKHSSSSSSDQFLQDDSTSEKRLNNSNSKLGFSEDEDTLIRRMFNLVGERWSLIAGRIPGRSAEEIEKYWRSTYS